jgi:hypothetical protein
MQMDTSNTLDWQTMPVQEFLRGDFLQRSDVVLVGGGGGSFFSRAIRWFTKSPFSHAALVFLIPQRDAGFEHTFLIESVISGVDITNLNHYAIELQKDKYIAVLRLEQDWFDSSVQKMVRGRMLNYIKASYDFLTIGSIASYIIRKAAFGVKARFSGYITQIQKDLRKGQKIPNEFICSGFVQYGFYSGVQHLVDQQKLEPGSLNQVLFRNDLDTSAEEVRLVSVTPQDLASSSKLTWKYVIKEGMVYNVSSEAEGKQLLGMKE